ncbi:MAG: hydroxyacylglutathione hydrolase [Pseudomonadota bacterium]
MIVEQLWVGNSYRNFNYLIACPATGDALAIDPLDYEQCLRVARERGWTVSKIVNTHEHGDHIGGNKAMVKATGAVIIAHKDAGPRIPNVGRGVAAGDVITVGSSVELECLDTPGHTMSHVCLLSRTDPPALFSGDTMFNAGAGNCHNGGHPEELYETFINILDKLPDNTRIYPGHDYLLNNLSFTLDREPGNDYAKTMLERHRNQDPASAYVTTLAEERRMNTFFRLDSPGVAETLEAEYGTRFNPKQTFLKLRELRNNW